MLQLILLILKIIGIVLLCLLGLFLFLLCMILFVPIRYRIWAERTAEPENMAAQAKITWLLHIVSVVFSYEEGKFERSVRIFGIRLNLDKKKTDTEKSKKRLKEPEYELPESTEAVKQVENNPVQSNKNRIVSQDESNPRKISQKEKQSFFSKCREFIKKLMDLLFNFKERLTALFKKLAGVKNNLDYYIEAFEDERNQRVIKLCLFQLGKIFKTIKPRKFRAVLHVGLGDPASTGQMLVILGMIYPLFEGGLRVIPEYEEVLLEGTLFLKGRVTSFVFLRAAWKIYFNKNFRRLMRILKKEAV